MSRHASGAPKNVRRRAARTPYVRAASRPPQLARSTSGSLAASAAGRRRMRPSGTHVLGCRARARGGWRTALGRGRRSGISWPRAARTPALTARPRPPGARRAAAAGARSGARPGEPAGGARAAGARETGHQGPRTVRAGSGPLNAPPAARHCAPQTPPAPAVLRLREKGCSDVCLNFESFVPDFIAKYVSVPQW